MEKTVTLLWGLPASGKTHYTKEAVPCPRSRLNKIAVVDVDRLLGKIKPEIACTVLDVDRSLGRIKLAQQ
jgi:predicted kinase